ncbi:50S ribosomal protein L23 [bacterium]|jgi:large subunit ribosomal protein L23|nr:50S ribosomal protein L23 [Verrucomicrobiota bacterium]NBX01254.1 50S ribosomal protein L23 [bacterium]
MKLASAIISRPIFTEKASVLGEANKYVFEILPGADRAQVKAAIEAAYKVTVLKVNILVRKGKVRRSRLGGGAIYTETPSRRAIVTLKKGDVISFA